VLTDFSREPRLRRATLILTGLLVVQVFLGLASYMMKVAARGAPQPLLPVVVVTTTHVAVGALVLAASLVTTLETYRRVTTAKDAAACETSGGLVGSKIC